MIRIANAGMYPVGTQGDVPHRAEAIGRADRLPTAIDRGRTSTESLDCGNCREI
jgi:hypothetical protein